MARIKGIQRKEKLNELKSKQNEYKQNRQWYKYFVYSIVVLGAAIISGIIIRYLLLLNENKIPEVVNPHYNILTSEGLSYLDGLTNKREKIVRGIDAGAPDNQIYYDKNLSDHKIKEKISFDDDFLTKLTAKQQSKLKDYVFTGLRMLLAQSEDDFKAVFATKIKIILKSWEHTGYTPACQYSATDHVLSIFMADSIPKKSLTISNHEDFLSQFILKLFHELRHARNAVQNSDKSCNPSETISQINDNEIKATFTLPGLPAALGRSLLKVDNEITGNLTKAFKKEPDERSQEDTDLLHEYEVASATYTPFMLFYSSDPNSSDGKYIQKYLIDDIKSSLQQGKPFYFRNISPPFYIFSYHEYSNGRILLSGYNTNKPNDKLQTFIVDTHYKVNLLLRPPYAQKDSNGVIDVMAPVYLDELDAFTYQSRIPFGRVKQIHAYNDKKSLCPTVHNATNSISYEKEISDEEMTQFYQQLKNQPF